MITLKAVVSTQIEFQLLKDYNLTGISLHLENTQLTFKEVKFKTSNDH